MGIKPVRQLNMGWNRLNKEGSIQRSNGTGREHYLEIIEAGNSLSSTNT